jgi:predicted CoA-binding protein
MRPAIESFFAAKAFAVVGASRNRRKFGNVVFREMKQRHLTVFPVNPHGESVEGTPCLSGVMDLPKEVEAVVTVVPPEQTLRVVEESHQRGIRSLWMQPGSQSPQAISAARSYGMNVVHGECILMFLEPVTSAHSFHRWLKKLVGRYPR